MSIYSNKDKETLLSNLAKLIQTGKITQEEVFEFLNNLAKDKKLNFDKTTEKQKSYTNFFVSLLSIFGIIVFFLGIFIFVDNFWKNNFARVLITFGLGMLSYILGIFLMEFSKITAVSIHLIAFLLNLIGVYVIKGSILDYAYTTLLGFLFLAVLYFFTDEVFKNWIFTTATIIFTTLTYGSSISLLSNLLNNYSFYKVLEFILILIYTSLLISLGRLPERIVTYRKKVLRFFEGLGYLFLFSYLFAYVQAVPFLKNLSSLIIFPFCILSMFIGSKIKSITLSIYSLIFIVYQLIYLNITYFYNSNFWALTLLIMGTASIFGSYFVQFLLKRKKASNS